MQPTDNDLFENEDSYLIFLLSLARITFLSYKEKIFLAKNLDSYNKLALLSIEEISKLIGRSIKTRAEWDGTENLRLARLALHYCKAYDIRILSCFEQAYPELLRQISNPPFVLFCRGNISLLCERSVSVVGTRRLTPQGKKAAQTFSYDAVMDGCTVVSGLAHGADSNAHLGAVNAFYDAEEKCLDTRKIGRTIAVLPSSIDEIVPSANKKLAEKILSTGGCIISEYEPRMTITNWHFVGRNRIIAGLSPATVVIEAPCGSGALITADFALDYGRDVLFHEVAFTELAERVSANVKEELEKKASLKNVSKYKMENSPQKFIETGAPIIKSYSDYCKKLHEAPGTSSVHPLQRELFDN